MISKCMPLDLFIPMFLVAPGAAPWYSCLIAGLKRCSNFQSPEAEADEAGTVCFRVFSEGTPVN